MIACIACLSCNNPDLPPEEQDGKQDNHQSTNTAIQIDRNLLYGDWEISLAKYTEDATMTEWEHESTTVTFKENGIYKADGYYGKVEGVYTIADNIIKVLIANELFVEYDVIEQKEGALTLCASYTSTPSKVWMELHRVEYIEITPHDPITSDDYYHNEESLKLLISGIYYYAAQYISSQLSVELFIFNREVNKLRPESSEIYNLWSLGYKVISQANNVISFLSQVDDSELNYSKEQYITHATVLRDFVFYNMNHLWGGIPLILEVISVDSQIADMARNTQQEVNEFLVADLSSLDRFTHRTWYPGEYVVSERVINMLLCECFLALKDNQRAKQYGDSALSGSQDDFFILFYYDTYNPDSKIGIPVYSYNKTWLYVYEANGQINGLYNQWENNFHLGYGYWAMLKRLGLAQEKTQCQEYELLLPIPQAVLNSQPNIVQNPGY